MGYKSFNVTTDVQGAVNLCSNDHGWLVKDQAETASSLHVNFVSRDDSAGSAQRPRLTVTYTPPPCVTNADCADTNFCTQNEQCVAGVCQVTPVNCDDGNPCTTDSATVGRAASTTTSVTTASCTTDICDPMAQACSYVNNASAIASAHGTASPIPMRPTRIPSLVHRHAGPDGTGCVEVCEPRCDSDSDQCTGGNCAGSPIICTPLDQCHDAGTCSGGICSDPFKPNGAGCDDGTLCTAPDTCDGAGTCNGGSPVVCTPLDQCHDAGTCDDGSLLTRRAAT
jgi:hypothetical protein